VPLGDLAANERNAITDGPFGSKLTTAHDTDAGPRVIRLENIGDTKFGGAKDGRHGLLGVLKSRKVLGGAAR